MSRRPIAAVAAGVALIVLVVVGGVTGSSASRPAPPAIETAPVSSATLVCPDLNGEAANTVTTAAAADVAGALTPPSQSTGKVLATVLAGSKSKPRPVTLAPAAVIRSRPKFIDTIAWHAAGSVAASMVADQVTETTAGRNRALAGVSCPAPATDWWFAGADGRVGYSDALALANPSTTPAIVSISMWGAKGPLSVTRLQSVHLAARSAVSIGIASIAPDDATIALHVHATSGAVTAALIDRRASALFSDGGDFMPATLPPARSAVVAGFPGGPGARQLILADPGQLDATVDLRLVTRTGSFTPAGINQVVVRANHTRVVSLDKAFDGTTGAVELTSDQPVAASGLSTSPSPPHRPDLMWLAATDPLVGSGGIATGRQPDGGNCILLLSAPQGRAQLRVSTPSGHSMTITVPAGHSVSADITVIVRESSARTGYGSWPFAVTTIGSAPIYGVRVLTFSGAHGALITGEPLVALPVPIVLPPVRPDPRIAMR